jgi:hypothetical protein
MSGLLEVVDEILINVVAPKINFSDYTYRKMEKESKSL